MYTTQDAVYEESGHVHVQVNHWNASVILISSKHNQCRMFLHHILQICYDVQRLDVGTRIFELLLLVKMGENEIEIYTWRARKR